MAKTKGSATNAGGRPNDPTVLILTSLAAEPRHGYALLGDIESFAGVRLGPGTLYGAIGRLEDVTVIAAPTLRGVEGPLPAVAETRIVPLGTGPLAITLVKAENEYS